MPCDADLARLSAGASSSAQLRDVDRPQLSAGTSSSAQLHDADLPGLSAGSGGVCLSHYGGSVRIMSMVIPAIPAPQHVHTCELHQQHGAFTEHGLCTGVVQALR